MKTLPIDLWWRCRRLASQCRYSPAPLKLRGINLTPFIWHERRSFVPGWALPSVLLLLAVSAGWAA